MGSANHPGVLRGDTTELGPDMQLNDTTDNAVNVSSPLKIMSVSQPSARTNHVQSMLRFFIRFRE